PSGYFATVAVKDAMCDVKSLNVASANIQVSSAAAVGGKHVPERFAFHPLGNPVRGPMAFALDLADDGAVNVAMFSADGRLVKTLQNAWMPAGTHRIHWNATDSAG